MRKSVNYFKSFSITLSLLILLKGCVVYPKTPVSLQEIALEKTRSKVEFNEGETHKFKYITAKDKEFYGVKQISSELISIRLNPDEISAVYPKNKTASTLVTLGPLALITGLLVVVWVSGGPAIGSFGWQ